MATKQETLEYNELFKEVRDLLKNGADTVQIPIENPPGYGYPPDDVRRAIKKRANKNSLSIQTRIVDGDGESTVVIY